MIGLVILLPAVPSLFMAIVETVRHSRQVLPLFRQWSDDGDPAAVYARRVYLRLSWSMTATFSGGMLLGTALLSS